MNANSFELSEVIKALRDDLAKAQTQGDGQSVRFNVTNVDIELQTVIEKEASTGAKIKFLVVDADANGKYKNAITHKIKLSLQAVQIDPAGESKNLQLAAEA